MKKLFRLIKDNRGVTALEYALIASLVGLVVIGGVSLLGTNLTAVFSKVATSV
jgi:pilus assembly protein Flp/PilA